MMAKHFGLQGTSFITHANQHRYMHLGVDLVCMPSVYSRTCGIQLAPLRAVVMQT